MTAVAVAYPSYIKKLCILKHGKERLNVLMKVDKYCNSVYYLGKWVY